MLSGPSRDLGPGNPMWVRPLCETMPGDLSGRLSPEIQSVAGGDNGSRFFVLPECCCAKAVNSIQGTNTTLCPNISCAAQAFQGHRNIAMLTAGDVVAANMVAEPRNALHLKSSGSCSSANGSCSQSWVLLRCCCVEGGVVLSPKIRCTALRTTSTFPMPGHQWYRGFAHQACRIEWMNVVS